MASSSSSTTRNPNQRRPPTIVYDSNHTNYQENAAYRVLGQIGTASNGLVQVHVAEKKKIGDRNKEVVTVKLVHSQDEPEGFNRLNQEIIKSEELPEHTNILGITRHFNYQEYLCAVCPPMQIGTVRSFMAQKSPGGLAEICIIVVLKEVLNGLVFLHERGCVHGSITAGKIYLNEQKEIKLGYSASMYDLGYSSDTPHVPSDDWVLAAQNNSQESDIWMIGVTALELAYGGLAFQGREVFESFLKTVRRTKRLPREEMMRNYKTGLLFQFKERIIDRVTHPHREFSKAFSKVVAMCLKSDPSKRPSAADLLHLQVFANCERDAAYFYDSLDNLRRRQMEEHNERFEHYLDHGCRV